MISTGLGGTRSLPLLTSPYPAWAFPTLWILPILQGPIKPTLTVLLWVAFLLRIPVDSFLSILAAFTLHHASLEVKGFKHLSRMEVFSVWCVGTISLSLTAHFECISKSCWFSHQIISSIQPLLLTSIANTLVQAHLENYPRPSSWSPGFCPYFPTMYFNTAALISSRNMSQIMSLLGSHPPVPSHPTRSPKPTCSYRDVPTHLQPLLYLPASSLITPCSLGSSHTGLLIL